MAGSGLKTEVQFLKGIGPRLAELLHKLNLRTVEDVLRYLPRRYEDRRTLPKMSSLRPGEFATVRGKLLELDVRPTRGGKVILKATIGDGTGTVNLTWFNQPWIGKKLAKFEGEIIAYGQLRETNFGVEISSPEYELVGEEDESENFCKIVAIYALTEGVQQWTVRKAVDSALTHFSDEIADYLTPEFRKSQSNLAPLRWAFQQIHRPETETHARRARERLVFDELFVFQLGIQSRRLLTKQEPGLVFNISSNFEKYWNEATELTHFQPTQAQQRVVEEIWADMELPFPMNRLLQGDVGSGKTFVAAAAMLAAVRCGYQAAIMAPTEILAEQHLATLSKFFESTDIRISVVLGKQKAKAKRDALESARFGSANIIVGTHALIQEGVEFQNLGLVIIDEQHRFGVLQRLALRKKGQNPDVLVMTATPIPRTMTMTLYGDLELSVIDEMPPGRSPVKTYWKLPHERNEVYQQVRKLIEQGNQAYFICPMISESEKMQTQAAVDLHYRLSNVEFKDMRVGLLHGQMKSEEKELVIEKFRAKECDILVSTVVVEVGVDVPSATIMVIEDANRFGLSQLHQLRGRVGRGSQQSYCILIADGKTEDSQRRLEILVNTTDGFKIAEEDLKLRGPGELAGTKQSGNLDFKIADLVRDAKMVEVSRRAAMALLAEDPTLCSEKNALMKALIAGAPVREALINIS